MTQNLEVHQCPVCYGKGLVPQGFYDPHYWHHGTTLLGQESCRSCGGKGYVTVYVPFFCLPPGMSLPDMSHGPTDARIDYDPNV